MTYYLGEGTSSHDKPLTMDYFMTPPSITSSTRDTKPVRLSTFDVPLCAKTSHMTVSWILQSSVALLRQQRPANLGILVVLSKTVGAMVLSFSVSNLAWQKKLYHAHAYACTHAL